VIHRAVILCGTETLAVEEAWYRQYPGACVDSQPPRIGGEKNVEAALAECRADIGANGAGQQARDPGTTLESRIKKLRSINTNINFRV